MYHRGEDASTFTVLRVMDFNAGGVDGPWSDAMETPR